MAHLRLLLSSLIILITLQEIHAVYYRVTNRAASTPGGIRFSDTIGVKNSTNILKSASTFIWKTFKQNSLAERKDVKGVHMYVEDIDGVAYEINNEIHVSANYIARYSGDVKGEITGVLFHETTHVWQWDGKGKTPGGLIEGIADYVRLKSGYVPSHWVGAGGGDRWDQGYDITARFLDYCNSLKDGFVAELNGKMRNGYSDNFFVELLEKTVDQLWKDYKAKYGS